MDEKITVPKSILEEIVRLANVINSENKTENRIIKANIADITRHCNRYLLN